MLQYYESAYSIRYANASETLQTFCLWSEDIHVHLESRNYVFDFFSQF